MNYFIWRQSPWLVVVTIVLLCWPRTVNAREEDSKKSVPRPTSLAIYALRYGSDSLYPGRFVFFSPDKAEVPFSWLVYLILADNRRILVDTGFNDTRYQKHYGIERLFDLGDLLAAIGESTQSVTDVIVTHRHIDHVGNMGLFPHARFVIQEDEYELMRKDKELNDQLKILAQERITLFKDEYAVTPQIKIKRVGGHTRGSSVIELVGRQQRFLFPGDNCYLEVNCREKRYVGEVENAAENKSFIDAHIDYPGLILTHHDPSLLKKSKRIAENIFLIYQE